MASESYTERVIPRPDYHTICDICGEDLGEERMYWAEEHLKKYPTHLRYRDKKVSQNQTV